MEAWMYGQEPSPGNYNFEGRYDLVRFVKLVQKAGMYMHLRIGPLVCAEWNFGGFPVWLNYVHGISFRTDNELFKVYDGAWTIIEKDSYRVVLQVLLNEQEILFCTLLFIEEDFKEVILPNQISEQHTRISGQRALDRRGFPPPLSLSVQQLWILQLLMRLQLNLSNGSEASLISGENPKRVQVLSNQGLSYAEISGSQSTFSLALIDRTRFMMVHGHSSKKIVIG